MRKFWSDMNPSVRGFLILGLIALTVVVLNLYTALASLYVLARVAFLLAIAFFFYLIWRERREEISVWPTRAKFALYGGAALIAADLLIFGFRGASGMSAVAFLIVLALSGYAMYRTWREQHSYGY
jgi:ABC-type nickel/cobalt efflux system permease component RcnA